VNGAESLSGKLQWSRESLWETSVRDAGIRADREASLRKAAGKCSSGADTTAVRIAWPLRAGASDGRPLHRGHDTAGGMCRQCAWELSGSHLKDTAQLHSRALCGQRRCCNPLGALEHPSFQRLGSKEEAEKRGCTILCVGYVTPQIFWTTGALR